MFASAEYMVCGLPVVSTRSIGGRDEYFDDRFCLICDDNPASVAAAVKEAISRNFDPNVIRNTFLAKVMERRTGLLQFIIRRTGEWEGSLDGFLRDWLNIGTPFLDWESSFTAPQLLEKLDSAQSFEGPRQEAPCKVEEPAPNDSAATLVENPTLENETPAMQERISPHSHEPLPFVVSFYGDGEQWLGHALVDFFDSGTLTGPRTELCRIMTEEGSDKGSGWHNYTLLYDFLFRHRRYEITSLFEVGVGTNFSDTPSSMWQGYPPGASLRGWRKYFPRAQIFGGDVDARILFSEERISTFYVDQLSDDSVDNLWRSVPDERFDIIIDDGLHSLEANSGFFRNAVQKLKPNGYYIIEDIVMDPTNLSKYHEFFLTRTESGVIIRIPNDSNNYDNCLAIFRKASTNACKDPEPSNHRVSELAVAVESAKLENETLRAEEVNLQSIVAQEVAARDALTRERDAAITALNQTISECDALAAAATRWFDAVIAVTVDHNPLARTPGRPHWRCTNLARRLSGGYRRPSRTVLANRARDAGKWELAVRYYRDALDLEPDDPEIWAQYGLALEKAGKTPEAEVACQKSCQLIAGQRA
jgi:tetratricopeptide (TPR) repeat protein